MASLSQVQFLLSGTDGKTGGAIGAVRVLSQTATGITTLSGVTIDDAMGNAVGDGTLSFTYATTKLTWTPYGGSSGTAVDVSSDGTYAIQAANDGGYLEVTVVASSLPGANVSNTITIAGQDQKVFDDWTKDETDAGTTRHRCLYFKNTGAESLKSGKLWVNTNVFLRHLVISPVWEFT